MSFSPAQIRSALTLKGFEEKNGSNHDKFFYHTIEDGKKTAVFTILSRGSSYKDYGDSLLGKMSKILRISRPQLNNLISCSMNRQEYEQELIQKKLIYNNR